MIIGFVTVFPILSQVYILSASKNPEKHIVYTAKITSIIHLWGKDVNLLSKIYNETKK